MSMASKAISYSPFYVSILEIALRCLLYSTREVFESKKMVGISDIADVEDRILLVHYRRFD